MKFTHVRSLASNAIYELVSYDETTVIISLAHWISPITVPRQHFIPVLWPVVRCHDCQGSGVTYDESEPYGCYTHPTVCPSCKGER